MIIAIRHRGFIRLVAIAAILSLFNSCAKDMGTPSSAGSPGANEVWIQNYAFTPSTITVPIYTTVKWTNKDAVTHTVTSTSSAASFDSGNINSGGTYSHQFNTSGTYPYKCSIHPNMTGTVIVH